MMNKRRWLIHTLFICLLLSLLMVSPAQAHGGELHGPAAPWVIALTYVQIVSLPFVGLWLARGAFAAWRPQHLIHRPEGDEP